MRLATDAFPEIAKLGERLVAREGAGLPLRQAAPRAIAEAAAAQPIIAGADRDPDRHDAHFEQSHEFERGDGGDDGFVAGG